MNLNRLLSAFLLMSLFAPAVRADIPVYPNEFNKLKKLTRGEKKDGTTGGYISPKDSKENGKKDGKSKIKTTADVAESEKAEDKAKTDSKTASKQESKSVEKVEK